MKKTLSGLLAAAVLATAAVTAPGAQATGSRVKGNKGFAPKTTLLSRTYRWQWDPFRVEGDKAYAIAWITNKHQYALELKIYCKRNGDMLRALSGRHLIGAGQTFRWDTRRLVGKSGQDPKAVVERKFWVDGSVDMRGRIVSQIPVRMGSEAASPSMITFNYTNFPPRRG